MEDRIKKDYRNKFICHGIIGVAFLFLGIVQWLGLIYIVDNSKLKVLFAIAIIAFATAVGPFLNFYLLKKDSAVMEPLIVAHSDERNIAVQNEAYAKTFIMLKWLIIYTFLTYTFLFPSEVFVSFGWWCITILLFTSLIMNILIYCFIEKKY